MGTEHRASIARGTLALAALLALFLARPLRYLGDHHYTSADFLAQMPGLLEVDPEHVPGNTLLSDEGTEMLPWLIHGRQELRAGRLPLWNPWNGGGVPQLANYQSAVLSPFSVPYYLLPLKLALVVGRALELFALGLFTFLFLREIGTRTPAAVLGAAAFAFSGHSILLLGYPHGDATVGLPTGLWLVERILRRAREGRSLGGSLFGLALAVAATLLAGQPEPAYFSLLLVAVYAVARVAVRTGAGPDMLAARLRAACAWRIAAALALGVGLAAPQILPFLEYLGESMVAVHRTGEQTPIPVQALQLALFPSALGDPTRATPRDLDYELHNMAYVGGTVLLLLLLALALARRRKGLGFFVAVVAAWIVFAFDPLDAGTPFEWIPTLADAPRNRSQPIFAFSAAAAASLVLDALLARPARRRPLLALATAAVGAALLAAGLHGARSAAAGTDVAGDSDALAGVASHLRAVGCAQIAATIAAAALLLARSQWVRISLAWLLVATSFLQTGWLLRDYNPVVPDELVYPRTPAVAAVAQAAAGRPVLALAPNPLPPHVNQIYGIALPSCFDALWIRRYDELFSDLFDTADNWRTPRRGSQRGLDLFGLDLVLSPWPWVHSRPATDHFLSIEQLGHRGLSLRASTVSEVFRSSEDGMDAVAVYLTRTPGSEACSVEVRVLDQETGEVLAFHTFAAGLLRSSQPDSRRRPAALAPPVVPPGEWLLLPIDAGGETAGRDYRLELRCPDGCARGDVLAIAIELDGAREFLGRELSVDGRPEPGMLLAAHAYDMRGWELLAEAGRFTLYRRLEVLDRYHIAADLLIAPTDLEARYILRQADLDLSRTAVLSAEDPALAGGLPPNVHRRELPGQAVVERETYRVAFLSEERGRVLRLDPAWPVSASPSPLALPRVLLRADLERHLVTKRLDEYVGASAGSSGSAPSARVVEQSATAVVLVVESEAPGVLVTPRPAYPGWRATVDGEERPVLRVNYAFLGVGLDAGTHEVEIAYVPRSFRSGLLLALASLVLLAWLCRSSASARVPAARPHSPS